MEEINNKLNKSINERAEESKNEFREDIKRAEKQIEREGTTNITVKTIQHLGLLMDKRTLAEKFYEIQSFFYDTNRIWWFWNKEQKYYVLTDETDLLNEINKHSSNNTVKASEKAEIVEALKQVGRTKKPLESPKTWVQFKDKIYDVKTKEEHEATPKYFTTNPITWEIGKTDKTPIIDKLFTEWVGEENKQTLYELIAYCCYTDYPIQLLFCLWGNGRNGKTQFIKILNKFIGHHNITSTELDTLTDNRFESFKLYKKLVCSIGETNFGILSKSSMIKKLTGGDLIGFEKKNKDPFDDYNYAKIIINSNSLPSSQDTSDGFYRRWMIIGFENEFEETGQEIWESVPNIEYNNLAKKILVLLSDLLKRGKFTNQGSIQERKDKYISVSNPLSLFIDSCCEKSDEKYVEYSKLYTTYVQFLHSNKRRKVSQREFKSALEDEGFYPNRTSKPIRRVDENGNEYTDYRTVFWVEGLGLSSDLTHLTHLTHNLTYFPTWRIKGKKAVNESNESNWDELCSLLLDTPSFPVEKLLAKGFTIEQIELWKSKGFIFEAKKGLIGLVK